MKRKFILVALAVSLQAAGSQAAINLVIEAKIANQTTASIKYLNASANILKIETAPRYMMAGSSTRFRIVGPAQERAAASLRFVNLGVDVEGSRVVCTSAVYECTVKSVREDCDAKRCLYGYSITVTRK